MTEDQLIYSLTIYFAVIGIALIVLALRDKSKE